MTTDSEFTEDEVEEIFALTERGMSFHEAVRTVKAQRKGDDRR